MAATVATLLDNLKNALSAIEGVQTCEVGLEADMTPGDYPMIRIVPSKLLPARTLGRRRVDTLVYFGTAVHEFDGGLQALYNLLLEMEEAIISAAGSSPFFGAVYVETIMDEDQVADAYKLMALRFDIEG